MATLVGTQKNASALLQALVELDYDAIEAYRAAIARLDRIEFREQFAEFCRDHERHVRDLSALMQQAGWEPPTGGDAKQILSTGKVVLGSLVGGDRAILAAMDTNEDDTNCAYERAQSRVDLSEQVRVVLRRNLLDERRHRAWIDQRLKLLEEQEDLAAREDDDWRLVDPEARL